MGTHGSTKGPCEGCRLEGLGGPADFRDNRTGFALCEDHALCLLAWEADGSPDRAEHETLDALTAYRAGGA